MPLFCRGSTVSDDLQRLLEQDKAHLNGETARVQWRELERFFAAGRLVHVAPGVDLVEAAARMARDDVAWFAPLQRAGRIGRVSDAQAKAWHEQDASLWAVVVRPWILVQPEVQA